MSPSRLLAAALLASLSFAAAAAEFDLNGGSVHFSAPSDWPVIMQMTEGNPQVVAFQVKDPAAEGTEESSRVSVTSRKLEDAVAYQAMVRTATDKAKQQTGYEQDKDAGDASSLRYTATEGKARYHYREHFYFRDGVGISLRCARPMLDKTSRSWVADFEKGCDQIAGSLAK
jgi:hypothetical protein